MSFALFVSSVGVGPAADQHPSQPIVTVPNNPVRRGIASFVPGVRVSPFIWQSLDYFNVLLKAAQCRRVLRRSSLEWRLAPALNSEFAAPKCLTRHPKSGGLSPKSILESGSAPAAISICDLVVRQYSTARCRGISFLRSLNSKSAPASTSANKVFAARESSLSHPLQSRAAVLVGRLDVCTQIDQRANRF